jgi:hypothetical protein
VTLDGGLEPLARLEGELAVRSLCACPLGRIRPDRRLAVASPAREPAETPPCLRVRLERPSGVDGQDLRAAAFELAGKPLDRVGMQVGRRVIGTVVSASAVR